MYIEEIIKKIIINAIEYKKMVKTIKRPQMSPKVTQMAPKWHFPITNQNDILIMSKTITYKSIADT